MLIVVEKVLWGKEINDDELKVIKKEQSKKRIDDELEVKEK